MTAINGLEHFRSSITTIWAMHLESPPSLHPQCGLHEAKVCERPKVEENEHPHLRQEKFNYAIFDDRLVGDCA